MRQVFLIIFAYFLCWPRSAFAEFGADEEYGVQSGQAAPFGGAFDPSKDIHLTDTVAPYTDYKEKDPFDTEVGDDTLISHDFTNAPPPKHDVDDDDEYGKLPTHMPEYYGEPDPLFEDRTPQFTDPDPDSIPVQSELLDKKNKVAPESQKVKLDDDDDE